MPTQEREELLAFEVLGIPRPAGSKRGIPFRRTTGKLGVRLIDDCDRSREWRQDVQAAAIGARTGGPLLDCALLLVVTYQLPRPKGHLNAKGQVRSSAPLHPTTRPDVLKLTRAIEDALTGIVWVDDSLIVIEVLRKEYISTSGTPRTRIRILRA